MQLEGSLSLLCPDPSDVVQVRQVKTIVVHPHFDVVSYDSDIALVQLDIPLEYNAAVRPVCLPNSTETLSSSYLCTASGWGITEEGGTCDFCMLPIINRT